MSLIVLEQEKCELNKLKLSALLKLLEYENNSYNAAINAYAENPEIIEVSTIQQKRLNNITNALNKNTHRWKSIFIHFEDNKSFLKIMKMTNLNKFIEIEKIAKEGELVEINDIKCEAETIEIDDLVFDGKKVSENHYLKDLLEDYNKNPEGIAFFFGAGLSTPLFPSWRSLLSKMISFCESLQKVSEEDLKDFKESIEKGESYLYIASESKKAMGETEYYRFLKKELDKTFNKNEIPENYKRLALLAPNVIVTTNYDKIPEKVSEGSTSIVNNKTISDVETYIKQKTPFILKLHGCISDTSTIVFTAEEYRKIIHNSPEVRKKIEMLLQSHTFVFLGFSFSDPHIDNIFELLQEVYKNKTSPHYALVEGIPRLKQKEKEESLGIRIIPYESLDNKHSQVSEFIELFHKIKINKNNSKKKEIPSNVIEKSNSAGEKGVTIVNYGTMVINKDIQNSTIDNLIKISNDSTETNKKLDQMFSKLDQKQTLEISKLTQKLIEIIDEKFIQTNQIKSEQVEEFEEIKRKYTSDTKIKLKQGIPFEWFIKQFTGFSIELEKEFKTSTEINPDIFISWFRNLLYGENVEEYLLRLRD
jgi:SIR2-like domain